MQPYQEAAQEVRRQGEIPITAAKNIASTAGAAASAYYGSGLVNRVLPFLSKYIPEDLAKKGLEKIDPRYGDFIDKVLASGDSFDSAREFIGDKIKEEEPKESGNIIQKYSKKLFQFMEQAIANGKDPLKTSSEARKKTEYDKVIREMEKDNKMSWDEIVTSVFGNAPKGMGPSGLHQMLSPATTPEEQQAAQATAMKLMGNPQMQQQPTQQQMGPGQQQLLSALQDLRKLRGG